MALFPRAVTAAAVGRLRGVAPTELLRRAAARAELAGVAVPTTGVEAWQAIQALPRTPEEEAVRAGQWQRRVAPLVGGAIVTGAVAAGVTAAEAAREQTRMRAALAPVSPLPPPGELTFAGMTEPLYAPAAYAPTYPRGVVGAARRAAAAFVPAVSPALGLAAAPVPAVAAVAATARESAWSRFWKWTGEYAPALIGALGLGTGAVAAGAGYGTGQVLEGLGELRGPAAPTYEITPPALAPPAVAPALPAPGAAAPTPGIDWSAVYLMR